MRINKRAAGIAAIDGRVGLNRFFDERGLAGLDGAAQRADHARSQRGLKTEGVANGKNFLAHLDSTGISQL